MLLIDEVDAEESSDDFFFRSPASFGGNGFVIIRKRDRKSGTRKATRRGFLAVVYDAHFSRNVPVVLFENNETKANCLLGGA